MEECPTIEVFVVQFHSSPITIGDNTVRLCATNTNNLSTFLWVCFEKEEIETKIRGQINIIKNKSIYTYIYIKQELEWNQTKVMKFFCKYQKCVVASNGFLTF